MAWAMSALIIKLLLKVLCKESLAMGPSYLADKMEKILSKVWCNME